MKTKRTFSLSQKGKVLAFCLGEKTKAFMPTSFLARAAMMLLVTMLTATTAWADSAFSGGDGSEGNPYKISSTADLNQLATDVNDADNGNSYGGKYFVLTTDLTYTGGSTTESNYTAIGDTYNDRKFNGKFDGNGHTISGIRIYKGDSSNQGLFGYIGSDSEVKKIILADARITGGDYTGGIVGRNAGGTIQNCHVLSSVTINTTHENVYYHGGIVGYNGDENSTVTGCTSAVAITTDQSGCRWYGGIAGYNGNNNNNGTAKSNVVEYCIYFGGTIQGDIGVGAIVGENQGGYVRATIFTNTSIQGKDNSGSSLANNKSAIGYKNGGWFGYFGLAYTITLGNNVTLGGTITSYGRLTDYKNRNNVNNLVSVAMSYNDGTSTTYYGWNDGATIPLNYTGDVPDGYTLGYTVTNGGTISGNATNGYTLTMPNANVTVTAEVTENVLELANGTSNATIIADAAASGKTYNRVILADRTLLKDGNWNTLCLPFDVTIASSPLAGDGVVAKVFANTSSLSEGGELTLNFSDAPATIPAGTPFIIKWTQGSNISNPTFSGVTISSTAAQEVESTDEKVKFVGQYSPFSIGDTSNDTYDGDITEILYVASGNKIGYSAGARTLKSCRAHFWVKPNGTAQAARSIYIDFGDGEATQITTTNFTNDMNSDGAFYDLQGHQVAKPTKGLYIVNGKKVVIK